MLTRSPALAASAAETGLKPSLNGQFVVGRARPLADHDVAARVAQVLGLGVALAAVADDRDRLSLEQRQIGILVVIHLGGHRHVSLGSSWLGRQKTRDGSDQSRGTSTRSGSEYAPRLRVRNGPGPTAGRHRLSAAAMGRRALRGLRPGAACHGPGRSGRSAPVRGCRRAAPASMNASIFLSWPEISIISCSGLTSTIRPRKICTSAWISALGRGGRLSLISIRSRSTKSSREMSWTLTTGIRSSRVACAPARDDGRRPSRRR